MTTCLLFVEEIRDELSHYLLDMPASLPSLQLPPILLSWVRIPAPSQLVSHVHREVHLGHQLARAEELPVRLHLGML